MSHGTSPRSGLIWSLFRTVLQSPVIDLLTNAKDVPTTIAPPKFSHESINQLLFKSLVFLCKTKDFCHILKVTSY
jgi:hypothetical protein